MVVVLPLSVVRFVSGFSDDSKVPHVWTFIVQFLYSLSGALNVFLFFTIRSGLLFSKSSKNQGHMWHPAGDDEESRPSHSTIDHDTSGRLEVAPTRAVETGENEIPMSAFPGTDNPSVNW